MNTIQNTVIFDADAEIALIMVTCEACGDDCPSHKAIAIDSDQVFDLYTGQWSVSGREALFCPDCISSIASEFQPNDGADEKFENSRFGRNR